MKNKLIYVIDAQCGWCYGNADNITHIYNHYQEHFDFELLNGGMWIGENAPMAGDAINDYIGSHLPRLVSYTGVEISDAYKSLIVNSDYVLSSLEPSAAIVWVKKYAPETAFYFAKAVQKIYFTEAKRLDELATYLPILTEYGISTDTFEKAWLSKENLTDTFDEFVVAQRLANGFPTLLLQTDEGITRLASGYFRLSEMEKQLDKITALATC